jgi:ABC-2 type transport system permease protein
MKLLRDTWLLFARSMVATLREPAWTLIGLFQPLCLLVLFAPLLTSIADAPGFPSGGALNVFTPGLLVLLGMFSTAFVGFGLIAELRAGLIERLRVTPVSRLALLLGRALRDVVILLVQSLLVVLAVLPFGIEIDFAGFAITLGLLALLGLFMSSCSYALALALKSEDALAPLLNTVTFPMALLSGIYLPLSLAPDWLRTVATVDPLTHAVDAARALFDGHIADAAVLRGVAVLAPLALLALWWAARSFRRGIA